MINKIMIICIANIHLRLNIQSVLGCNRMIENSFGSVKLVLLMVFVSLLLVKLLFLCQFFNLSLDFAILLLQVFVHLNLLYLVLKLLIFLFQLSVLVIKLFSSFFFDNLVVYLTSDVIDHLCFRVSILTLDNIVDVVFLRTVGVNILCVQWLRVLSIAFFSLVLIMIILLLQMFFEDVVEHSVTGSSFQILVVFVCHFLLWFLKINYKTFEN